MTTMTRNDLHALAHSALNGRPVADQQAKELIAMAEATAAASPNHTRTLQSMIEYAEMDLDITGHISEGVTVRLIDALIEVTAHNGRPMV